MNETRREVQRLAVEGVEMLQERAGGALDYSVQSLEIIEEILAEAYDYFSDLPQGQVKAIVQRVGCYILDVAYRQFGGQFFWHDEYDQPILVVGEPEKHIALVTWGKVHGRIAGDAGDNIPFFYAGFSDRVANSKSGTREVYV
ncbi:hypothetical protein FHT03_000247 [Xanthomonas arboricola]|uniref:hypothetical protein n=1 Tax=Xanthomonas cannabis TaxID=1885674 RepID=UPI0016081FEC|nr:hypothetical protein [Xanthomonas cannabis]MBB3804749.1 hypothetical protein [Xanthomonas cannabis]